MPGRHQANGPTPEPFVPVRLDVREHAVAAKLTAAHPNWFVVWGTYWRCWSAFARFNSDPVAIHFGDVHVLRARMREAELAARSRRGW